MIYFSCLKSDGDDDDDDYYINRIYVANPNFDMKL